MKRPGYLVPLKVDVSRPKLDRLVSSLGERFHRDAVDATLKLRNLTPFATKDVPGRRLKEVMAERADLPRAEDAEARSDRAAVRDGRAGGDIGPARACDRDQARLEPAVPLQARASPKLVRQFQVATGRSQYPTPLGKFEIVTKQLNPWWYPARRVRLGGGLEADPARARATRSGTRWMGISAPYVGIHGTPDAASIGYSASHGCIRMLIPQVEWLFTQVDVGTPVFIVAA